MTKTRGIMEAIDDVEAFLTSSGLVCGRREVPADSMDYRLVEYEGSEIRVRFVHEKSYWNIYISDKAMASDVWYDVRLFTYLLDGPPQPKMPLQRQKQLLMDRWTEIMSCFGPKRRVMTHARLDAAKMERARTIYAIWPTIILDLESWLKQQGLVRRSRKEPRFMFDWMSTTYSNTTLAVRMSSENGWHVDVASVVHDPDHWYPLALVKRLIEGSREAMLPYAEILNFMKDNWHSIIDLFSVERCRLTSEQLYELEVGSAP